MGRPTCIHTRIHARHPPAPPHIHPRANTSSRTKPANVGHSAWSVRSSLVFVSIRHGATRGTIAAVGNSWTSQQDGSELFVALVPKRRRGQRHHPKFRRHQVLEVDGNEFRRSSPARRGVAVRTPTRHWQLHERGCLASRSVRGPGRVRFRRNPNIAVSFETGSVQRRSSQSAQDTEEFIAR